MATGKRIAVYVGDDIYRAIHEYRNAGCKFNMAKAAQLAMIDKMISIERARRAIGEPYIYTLEQLAKLREKFDD